MDEYHISEHDMERYYLGMIQDSEELSMLETHLLWCQPCLDRIDAVERFVDSIRAGAIRGNFDLDVG
jgi:hypothetical protein